LALGDHSLEVRGTLAGMPVSAQSTLTVTNEGLLAAETTANSDGRLVIHLETSVPLGLLGVRGVVDGVEIRPTRDGDLFFDHWALSPGTHEVEITALAGGEVAAQRILTVDIPALEPELAVRADTEATPPVFHVSARVQRDAAESTIRVLIDGAVFEEGPADETLRLEGIEDATVDLLGADGEPLLSESVRTLSSDGEEGGRNTWPMILLGLGVLGAAGGARALYRRPLRLTLRRPKARPRPVRARPARRPVSVSTNRDTFGQLVLRTPEGEERTVQIGLKPLTVGSSAECDVVLDSPTIRPVHARVSARPNGEFQVHGVAQSHASPYLNDRHDEWAVLVSGESIAIGDHVITLLTAAETEEVDRAIFHN